jgi:solute:Na+ symporter, SSS family
VKRPAGLRRALLRSTLGGGTQAGAGDDGVITSAAVGTGIDRASLVDLLLGANGGVAQIMSPVLAALDWRRATGVGAIAGLVGGLVVNVLFLVRPELRPIAGLHEGVYGLAVNVPLLVGVSLATRPEPEELVESFVEA